MKKLLTVFLVLVSLTLGTMAGAQSFSVNVRNWDLLVFTVEGEFYAMPQLSVEAGAGVLMLGRNWGLMGGARYFANSDHSGLYGVGRLLVGFSDVATYGTTTYFGFCTAGGYRWVVGSRGHFNLELGLIWLTCPGCYGAIPVVSWGFGVRF